MSSSIHIHRRNFIVGGLALAAAAGAAALGADEWTRAHQQRIVRWPARHNLSIYAPPAGRALLSPFSMKHSPMRRLLLVSFENDPDSIYKSLELQYFDDAANGRGLLVIAYRLDQKIDVYYQTGLTPTANFDVVGAGLNQMVERALDGARFEVGPQGLDAQFTFDDLQGRPITARVQEQLSGPRGSFPLLAPLGQGAENPPTFPMILMDDFSFVPQNESSVEVRIAERLHTPDALPIPIKGKPVWVVRYSPTLYILDWNTTEAGPLGALTPPGAGTFTAGDITYDLTENEGHLEINRLQPAGEPRDLRLDFYPPFPNLADLRPGERVQGEFTFWLGEQMGRISGRYGAERGEGQARAWLEPTGGWQPGERDLSVWVMFLFVPMFKAWPKTYRWEAQLDLSAPDAPTIAAGWKRV